jgi:putative spermidine/putrescine transport system substrate-binding protein
MKKSLFTLLSSVLLLTSVGCASKEVTNDQIDVNQLTIEEITEKAQTAGEIVTTGMPDTWANLGDTWGDLEGKYGIKHTDTDMGSAKSIAKWDAERENPTADMADVGVTYGPIAVEKELAFPYKTSYWESIPDWAKDEEGKWIMAYYGVMVFMTNNELVDKAPKSFKDILEGDYTLSMYDITANTTQMAIVNTALGLGGDLNNLQPGIDFFATLAKEGRLKLGNSDVAGLESGEVQVTMNWDFNALSWRDNMKTMSFDITVPEEGGIISGNIPLINRYAPNPYSAMLAREYMLSDEGQINFAKGYGHPIREDVELPKEIKEKYLPDEEYERAIPLKDLEALQAAVEKIPAMWEEQVLVHMN